VSSANGGDDRAADLAQRDERPMRSWSVAEAVAE
jgi:hypothetical protein